MRKITIFVPHRFMLSSLAIPYDLFKGAGVYWRILRGQTPQPLFEVTTVSVDGHPVESYGGLHLTPDGSIHEDTDSETILLPPSEADDCFDAATTRWLLDAYERGADIASICLGAFPLARTGLLDGRRATTHWGYADRFRREFPAVQLAERELIVDEGRLLCSGGANAGGDLALHLIARYAGAEVSGQTARVMLADGDRRMQAPYQVYHFNSSHQDVDITAVQHWLGEHFSGDFSVGELADRANMSRRTFERRFKEACGDSPRHYIQRLRVERAKELLEQGAMGFDAITTAVGYSDSSTFSRIFKKQIGLSPGAYRQKFGLRE